MKTNRNDRQKDNSENEDYEPNKKEFRGKRDNKKKKTDLDRKNRELDSWN